MHTFVNIQIVLFTGSAFCQKGQNFKRTKGPSPKDQKVKSQKVKRLL